MEKHARSYLSKVHDYDGTVVLLFVFILYSVANILFHFLSSIPLLQILFEAVEWNGYLAPSASLPLSLLLWQIGDGRWWLGAILAVLALMPYVLAWLISTNRFRKTPRFVRRGFWLMLVWYGVDTAIHLYQVIFTLIYAFSIGSLFWGVVGLVFRAIAFMLFSEGITAPKKVNNAYNELVAQTMVCYILENGAEKAKQMPMAEFHRLARQYVNKLCVLPLFKEEKR